MTAAGPDTVRCARCGRESTPGGQFCPFCGTPLGDGETLPLVLPPPPRAPVGGKFQILRELGRGGFGIVYEARDTVLDRTVALKTFRPEGFTTPQEREAFERRFLREAKAIARLAHPNIVALFEVGQDQGLFFLAMEYVKGRTLRQLLADRGPLPAAEVTEILRRLAEALDHAHREGIVHRDVKPENVMIRDDGLLKVADFGVAKALGAGTPTLTEAGSVLGTPSYMAPEQVQGLDVDGRADQFSTCAVGYEMLTGRRPFQADTMPALIYKILHQHTSAPDAVNPSVPAALSALVMRGLSKDREERFPTCADLARALAGFPASATPDRTIRVDAGTLADEIPTQAVTPPAQTATPTSPWRRGGFLALGALAVAAAALILTRWERGPGSSPDASPAPRTARDGPAPATPDPRDARIEDLIARLEALETETSAAAWKADGAKGAEPPVDPTKRQVLETVARLQEAFEGLDVDGLMKLFDPDAEAFLPAGTLRSPEAIRELYRNGFQQIREERIDTHELQIEDGSLQIGAGTASLRFTFDVGGLVLPGTGRYEVLLGKSGGAWRVTRLELLLPGVEELTPVLDALTKAIATRSEGQISGLLAPFVEVKAGGVRLRGQEAATRIYRALFRLADPGSEIRVDWLDLLRDDVAPSVRAQMDLEREGTHHQWSATYTFRQGEKTWRVTQVLAAVPEELVALVSIPRLIAGDASRAKPRDGFGFLSITCEPPAAVWLDGAQLETTPLVLELPLHEPHSLRFGGVPGHDPTEDEVVVKEARQDLRVRLDRVSVPATNR